MAQHRRHSAEFKAKVALEAIKGQRRTLRDLTYYQWMEEMVDLLRRSL